MVLDGRGGTDTLKGGIGNDIYIYHGATTTITELASEGTDTVQSDVTVAALMTNVENLVLNNPVNGVVNGTGNTLNNVITGNDSANTLTGLGGNDTLDGGLGNDTMLGGIGNDTYIVGSTTDVVTELAAEGTDLVKSSVDFTLSVNVENLTLLENSLPSGLFTLGTGNALANTITGNSGDNILDGLGGIDTMIGGAGNDVYVIDSLSDVVTEAANAGIDRIASSVTYTLTALNVEDLSVSGSGAVNLTGNSAANSIQGNGAANIINGGAGNDTLSGGLGNDIFVFNTALSSTNRDTITDFNVANDTINLENTGNGLFNALTTIGAIATTAFVKNTTGVATSAAQRIIFDSDGTGTGPGVLYYDPDGTGAAAKIQFATVTAGLAITNLDFVVI